MIGWFAHALIQPVMSGEQLTPEQQRVVKAQQLLQSRQLLLENTLPQAAIPNAYAEAAIAGMLTWSQDRHGDLYGPLATARYQQGVDGISGFTDLRFSVVDNQIVVVNVPANSPGDIAGVEVGDILLEIDGIPFDQFMGAPEAVLLLQGPVDSTLTLTLQRGNEIFTRLVTRKERTYLSYRLINNEIGYLKTNYFFPNKTQELLEAMIEEFSTIELRALIWDLRDNGGGYPAVAENIIGYFRQPDSLFYSVEFKDGTQREFRVAGDARFAEIPVVVLIDSTTWSTGEIVAAAMAAGPSTQLIGTPTVGKGIIQDTVALDDRYMLHFTIAKWLTPTGEWIHQEGVLPDITVVDDLATNEDEVMEAALDYLNDVLTKAN